MPYFKTSYDTTAGQIFNAKKLLDQPLKEALVGSFLTEQQFGVETIEQRKAVFLTGDNDFERKVPAFIHPYLIQNFKSADYLVTDIRLFRGSQKESWSASEFEKNVRNRTEYSLVKSRAALNLVWLATPSKLRTRFTFAGSVFSAWLSQAIARAYALDFHDQMRIMALSIYYYHTLFIEGDRLEEGDLETAVIHTIKATKFPATDVYKLFENVGSINGIEDFCNEVRKVVENVRLRDFNLAMLLTLVRNTWYGTNAKDLIAVALEHPPTWITIVYTTLTERSYKSSSLYKLIETVSRRGNADEFRMNFLELIKDTVVALETADNGIVFKDFEE